MGKMVVRTALALIVVVLLLSSAPSRASVARAAPPLQPPPAGPIPNLIVVNRSDDADLLPCTGGPGANDCTLRSAITRANGGTFYNIRFAASMTILPSSTLPHITTQGTWIDGSDGNGAPLIVVVDGQQIPNGGGDVFVIVADDVTLSHLNVNDASTTNADIAIWSGKDVRIAYNTLGLGSLTCNNLARSGGYGLWIGSTSGSAIFLGATAYIYGNIIGCHSASGIWLSGARAVWIGGQPDGTLTGNHIGNDGALATPNAADGILISNGASGNTFEANTISGNDQNGVRIVNSGGGNAIGRSNMIGLTANGLSPLPNAWAGVAIISDTGHLSQVGGGASSPTYISGNGREGIYIQGSSQWNIPTPGIRIGVAADNTTPMGNGLEGIMVKDSSDMIIAPEKVSHNGGAGIAVVGASRVSFRVYSGPTELSDNGGLPVDLGNDGHTANGLCPCLCPCPNNWQPYPVISAASSGTITGTACANCRLDLYRALGNPAAPYGGGIFMSEFAADGSGNWSATLPAGLTSADVTLVATDPVAGTSSEMSPRPAIALPLIVR